MAGGAAVHYLRHNAQSKQSRRHIFVDTEARISYGDSQQTQSWLCGVARYLDTDTRRKTPLMYDSEYGSPRALWDDVSDFTRPNSRTILWAHNLAYDLRISRALEILPPMGWSLRAIVLDSLSCWAKFTRDSHTLVCADFTSWASDPLSRIGAYLNIGQEPLPTDPDDIRGMFKRCQRDVEILYAAVTSTLEWLQTNDLGNLQITGAGQAWTAFRHRFMTDKILVHDDQAARTAERRAIWTGRTEAWKHGTFTGRGLQEFDLTRAYATIARDCALPTVYVGKLPRASRANFSRWTETRRLLCDVSVSTSCPAVPTAHNDRILWPVGQFRTTLWDCEIQLLLDRGARVRIHRTYVYTSTKCLSVWAEWILAQLDTENAGASPLQKRILKAWSRSLIGRFALQYRSWAPMGTADSADLYLAKLAGKRERKGAAMLHVGDELLELGAMTEGENSLPQLTGYVTAMCRVRLWELMETAGLDHVYYVDTDSIITDATGGDRLRSRIRADGAYGLMHKRSIGRLELQGPRQLTVDGERRHSGVPKRAIPTGSDEVRGEVWEGFGEALRHGRTGKVLVYERTFKLNGSDHRRRPLPDGDTEPFRLSPDPPKGRGAHA